MLSVSLYNSCILRTNVIIVSYYYSDISSSKSVLNIFHPLPPACPQRQLEIPNKASKVYRKAQRPLGTDKGSRDYQYHLPKSVKSCTKGVKGSPLLWNSFYGLLRVHNKFSNTCQGLGEHTVSMGDV